MQQVLSIHNLEKGFRARLFGARQAVLSGVNLELQAGQNLGLVGPNGSGKSTLLRILAGVEAPDAGKLSLFGASPSSPAARARVGFLAENTPFPAELSASAALELVAGVHGWGRRERSRMVHSWLERVGLAQHASKRLGNFSKGMLRRFGLAMASLHSPDLLLLDEPTAGLDAEGHLVLGELLAEARSRAASLIIASHQLNDIIEHCDQLIILVEGRVIASGAPSELLGKRAGLCLEVQGLGEPELERLEETIEELGGKLLTKGPAGQGIIELYRSLNLGPKT